MGKLDKPTLTGIVLCALPVASFSAWSQFETARLAGVPWPLAWVFPMATDATAFVSTRVWLDPDNPKQVRGFAAKLTWTCILLAIGGAAAHLVLMTMAAPPFWVKLTVGGLPTVSLAGLVHLGAIIVAANVPAKVKKTKAAKTAGTVEHRPPTSTVPAPKPAPAAAPEVGKGSKRTLMLSWLDENPDAADSKTIGAELDQLFGTSNYGRGVARAWRKARDLPKASGE